jgi:hypothetical protein
MCVLVQDLGYARSALWGVTLPEDAVRQEAKCVYSEQLWTQRQRRWAWSATRAVARTRGEDTPSEPESSGGDDEEEDEDAEEGEVTPPPHSPLPKDLPSLGDVFSRQAGIPIGAHRSKWPWTETRLSTSPPPQPYLALVSFDL